MGISVNPKNHGQNLLTAGSTDGNLSMARNLPALVVNSSSPARSRQGRNVDVKRGGVLMKTRNGLVKTVACALLASASVCAFAMDNADVSATASFDSLVSETQASAYGRLVQELGGEPITDAAPIIFSSANVNADLLQLLQLLNRVSVDGLERLMQNTKLVSVTNRLGGDQLATNDLVQEIRRVNGNRVAIATGTASNANIEDDDFNAQLRLQKGRRARVVRMVFDPASNRTTTENNVADQLSLDMGRTIRNADTNTGVDVVRGGARVAQTVGATSPIRITSPNGGINGKASSASPTAVPEPITMTLPLAGIALMRAFRKKRSA